MSGCTVQRLEAPGLTYLKVSGTVDETFSASQLSQQIRADTILHLGKVSRFSSFGVREWVRLMKELQGRVKHCVLVECSPAVVNQLNMVVDFAAGAHVKSVQLPYACPRCELDKMVTVDVDADRAQLLAGHLPQVPCPQCKNPMVFDDLPGSYLAFLRDAAAPEPGSPMAAFISSFEQAAPRLAESESPSGGQPAAAARPAPPGIDPTVPPPGMGPAGMPPAAKWAAAAALVVLLAGGGYMVFGGRKVDPPPPPPPNGNGTAKVDLPPAKPEPRAMKPEEGLELGGMLNTERFAEADAFIAKMEPLWQEDSTNKAKELVKGARTASFEKHMSLAQVAMRKGDLQLAEDEMDAAQSANGESDRILWQRLTIKRRAGDCPSVETYANAIEAGYPDSSYKKQATDARAVCQRPPAIPGNELKRAIAVLQNDIDKCLESSRTPDQGGNSIDLAWTISPTGAVKQVGCTTPALAKSNLCSCLKEQVQRLRFTEKPEIKVRRASWTFTSTQG